MSTSVQVHTSSTRESFVVPICRAKVVFFAWQGLRVMHRHSHARTLMFANAASVLTQAVVRILRFGVLLAASSFTGRGVMSQSPITGLGASTKVGLSVTLSGILAAAAKNHRGPPSPQLHLSCVSRACQWSKT
jgi:hypothetical protein